MYLTLVPFIGFALIAIVCVVAIEMNSLIDISEHDEIIKSLEEEK